MSQVSKLLIKPVTKKVVVVGGISLVWLGFDLEV
jgi:hypothetical protein